MTAEPPDDTVTEILLFQSADRSGVLNSCIEQDDDVGGLARCFHFKTTY